jgi:hypothetical protein
MIGLISSLKRATLLQVEITVRSHSLNRVERWIWHLDTLDIPDGLTIGHDRIITAKVSALGKRCQTPLRELSLIQKDGVNLVMSLAVRVKI